MFALRFLIEDFFLFLLYSQNNIFVGTKKSVFSLSYLSSHLEKNLFFSEIFKRKVTKHSIGCLQFFGNGDYE